MKYAKKFFLPRIFILIFLPFIISYLEYARVLCSIFIHLEGCIHYPGHLVDVNEVKNIWVILLHTEDDEVHQLQLHVFQPGILAVKHPGDLPVALLSLQPLQVVDQHLLHLLQAVGPLHVAAHGEDDQLAAILGGEGSEPDRSRGGLTLSLL